MTDQFNKTVLVVDDDRIFLDSLEQFLLQRGYYCKAARDADSALKIIRGASIDVVVADVVIPGKDGIQLMNEAKSIFPDFSAPQSFRYVEDIERQGSLTRFL